MFTKLTVQRGSLRLFSDTCTSNVEHHAVSCLIDYAGVFEDRAPLSAEDTAVWLLGMMGCKLKFYGSPEVCTSCLLCCLL